MCGLNSGAKRTLLKWDILHIVYVKLECFETEYLRRVVGEFWANIQNVYLIFCFRLFFIVCCRLAAAVYSWGIFKIFHSIPIIEYTRFFLKKSNFRYMIKFVRKRSPSLIMFETLKMLFRFSHHYVVKLQLFHNEKGRYNYFLNLSVWISLFS